MSFLSSISAGNGVGVNNFKISRLNDTLQAINPRFKQEILKLLTPPPFPADIEDEEDTGTTVLTARATFSEIRY